jgi:hypothetical protein
MVVYYFLVTTVADARAFILHFGFTVLRQGSKRRSSAK